MKSPKINIKLSFFPLALVLAAAIPLAATSSLHAQALADACLVYTTRTTSKSTGYSSGSYTAIGMVVVGPEYAETVEGFGGDGEPTFVEVRRRVVQDYSFFSDSFDKRKKYYMPGFSQALTIGLINLAKAGSTKPSMSVALTYGGAVNSLSDTDIIGKASWKSPYAGVNPGWLATSLSTSYKFYDVNPDRDWENPDAPYNYLGQVTPDFLPCTINSGKTTYALDAKRSASVKGMTFEEARAAVESWLETSGYERVDDHGGPEL